MRNADNHIGWVVEWLSDEGWRPVTMPSQSRDDSALMRDFLQNINPQNEYRVMEFVK